jgi:hypothetical protein
MDKEIDIKSIFNLMGDVESNTLHTHQDTLMLSDNLTEHEENSPYKPPFNINFLEYYDSSEPVTSWIIRHFFAYTYKGRHPFFNSFADVFLTRIGFKPEWIDNPIVIKDHEYKSIDILVRDKRYAVITENKLKRAKFQLNQIARYIASMRNEGYSDEQIYVVVLPEEDISNEDIPDSVWRLPTDWQSTNANRKCRIDDNTCWCDCTDYQPKAHCAKCEPLEELYNKRTLFIHKELAQWLYDCAMNNAVDIPKEEFDKQYVLKSAVLQFVDYLNSIYQTRENDKYKMDNQKFLNEQLKLNDLDIVEQMAVLEEKERQVEKLAEELDNLIHTKALNYIDEISRKYRIHLTRKCDFGDYFFYDMKVDGIALKISLDKQQGGKIYCQIDTKESGGTIPEIVKDDFEIAEELNDKGNSNNCIWKYGTYRESLLRFDRVLGRLFEIQNSK